MSTGGTQKTAGNSTEAQSSPAGFGYGAGSDNLGGYRSSDGGGYYGGGCGGSTANCLYGGAGGSSFISGMTSCVAIDPTDTTGNPRKQDADESMNYNSAVFGPSVTWDDGDEITFTNWSMIDGTGYEWNTGAKGTLTNMLSPTTGNTITGNPGNGYARIKLLLP
jgi:hypothetical protein